MKGLLGFAAPAILLLWAGEVTAAVHGTVWKIVFALIFYTILSLTFVQKYPKIEAWKWALNKLRRGETITIEGK